MQKTPLPVRRHRRRFLLLMVAVLVSLIGAILWMLSEKSVLPESSWTAIGAAFTVVGVAVSIIQLFAHPSTDGKASISSHDTASSERKGSLIIRAGKQLCGSTVNLCSGFNTTRLQAEFASNIVERWVGGIAEYVGKFPSLEPGNYTAYIEENGLVARVTILGGRPSEIDWRYSCSVQSSRNEKGRGDSNGSSEK